MRIHRLASTAGILILPLLVALVALTPSHAAPAPVALPEDPPEQSCWNVKTTICSDCADADSKYCDPRSAEGPFATCIQTLTEPCPGFTCSSVDAKTGAPCS